MLKTTCTELPDFRGWYRWDFVYNESCFLIFTTFSPYNKGLYAKIENYYGYTTMTIYSPMQIIGYVTAKADCDGKTEGEDYIV